MAGGFAERLGDTRARTLVVASEDPFLPPDFLEQAVVGLIPGATMSIVTEAGHYVQVEQPEETARVVGAFLKAES